MRERAQCECVFIEGLGIRNEGLNEVSGTGVMRQVAEISVAVRIVTHVLDDRAAIRESVRFLELFRRRVWKTLEQDKPQSDIPQSVDHRFMRQHRVSLNLLNARECKKD